MQRERVQGLAIAVIDGGRVIHVAAYGVRNAAGEPLTTQTIMYGASLTKTAFTYMVMQLVDEGRLTLDAPIAGLLPRPLPEYDDYHDLAGDARWKSLTLRILQLTPRDSPTFDGSKVTGSCVSTTIPVPDTAIPGKASTSPNSCSRRPWGSMSGARCRPECSIGSA